MFAEFGKDMTALYMLCPTWHDISIQLILLLVMIVMTSLAAGMKTEESGVMNEDNLNLIVTNTTIAKACQHGPCKIWEV